MNEEQLLAAQRDRLLSSLRQMVYRSGYKIPHGAYHKMCGYCGEIIAEYRPDGWMIMSDKHKADCPVMTAQKIIHEIDNL